VLKGKKIWSSFLLVIYLLVIAHSSAFAGHAFIKSKAFNLDHSHENHESVHHEHSFHIGIFHFIKHLIESINESNDYAGDHLIHSQNVIPKKTTVITPSFWIVTFNNYSGNYNQDRMKRIVPLPDTIVLRKEGVKKETPPRGPPAEVC